MRQILQPRSSNGLRKLFNYRQHCASAPHSHHILVEPTPSRAVVNHCADTWTSTLVDEMGPASAREEMELRRALGRIAQVQTPWASSSDFLTVFPRASRDPNAAVQGEDA